MRIDANLKNKDSDFWDKTECVTLLNYCSELKSLLKELHAIVTCECPSLLNEDSGGTAALDIEIKNAIND